MHKEEISQPKALNKEQGQALLKLARNCIQKNLDPSSSELSSKTKEILEDPIFQEKRGTFVTLEKDKNLRGCIGSLVSEQTILEDVKRNSINAAFHDPRFPPLKLDELKQITLELSILTQPQPLAYSSPKELLENLIPGKHGVILKKGPAQSTFLPQVWEQLPGKEQFLSQLCLKAGLRSDAWKLEGIQILTYEVQKFEETS